MRSWKNRILLKQTVDRWPIVPNSYVNDDGKPNLNNSNADNENDVRLSARCKGRGQCTLLSQPPIIRRASLKRACIFKMFVSLARLSSSIARKCKVVISARALALSR